MTPQFKLFIQKHYHVPVALATERAAQSHRKLGLGAWGCRCWAHLQLQEKRFVTWRVENFVFPTAVPFDFDMSLLDMNY